MERDSRDLGVWASMKANRPDGWTSNPRASRGATAETTPESPEASEGYTVSVRTAPALTPCLHRWMCWCSP